MAKQQYFWKVTFAFQVLKKYYLNELKKPSKLLRIQFNRYFQAAKTTAIANIQIEERKKVKTRELNNSQNLYSKWDK